MTAGSTAAGAGGRHLPDSTLPDVASVRTTVLDLAQTLTERCGIPSDSIRTLRDPASPIELGPLSRGHRMGCQVTAARTVVATSAGAGCSSRLRELYAWVREDSTVRVSRARLTLVPEPFRPGTPGGAFGTVNAVPASGAGLATLVLSALGRRGTRERPPRIRFERDGVTA